MSHEVETMMHREEVTPWHGLGVKVEGAQTWEQAMLASGLNWTVATQPMAIRVRLGDPESFPDRCPTCDGDIEDRDDSRVCVGEPEDTENGEPCGWSQPVEYAAGPLVSDAKAAVRSSDSKVLGVVGRSWTPLQNVDAFRWFDPFVEQGLASYWTAGSLRGGEFVWVLARIGSESTEIGSDLVNRYVLLSNAHNGTRAARIGFTNIVVVCANTLAAAHDDASSKLVRVRHTASVKENLELLRDTMNLATAEFEATADQYRLLQMTDIVEADLKRYVRTVFFDESEADNEKVGLKTLEKITRLYETGLGAAERKHNVWRAYQAVTEYLSWGRGRTPDSRMTKVWFGDSAKLNTKALLAAVKMAGKGIG